jgi:hypothetical protein
VLFKAQLRVGCHSKGLLLHGPVIYPRCSSSGDFFSIALTQVLGVEKPGKIKERKGCSCVQRACPSVSIGLRACRFVPLWPLRNVRSCCNVWAALIASAKALVVLALAVPTCCAVASPNSGVERPLSATTTDCSWPIVPIQASAAVANLKKCASTMAFGNDVNLTD